MYAIISIFDTKMGVKRRYSYVILRS